MCKKDKLEEEFNFEMKKAEILERKSNIYYKLVVIIMVGYISININLFNFTMNDFYSTIEKNENKFKDDLKLAIDATRNAKNQEISKQNEDFQLKIIKEHMDNEEIMKNLKQKVEENKNDFFSLIFKLLILLSMPFLYFYYRMNHVERKIIEIRKELVNENKKWKRKIDR